MQAIEYMKRALVLAKRGQYTTRPNPAVGCVIVKDGIIVGEGWHQKAGEPHAEIIALRMAGEKAKDATCYVTLEPCSHWGKTGPCCDALIKAQVQHVVVAMTDPNPLVNGAGCERLRQAGIHVETGLLKQEAENLNQGFCYHMREKKPFVRLKMAMSLDGRTAMQDGESQWISCEESRINVQQLRARCGALITGIGTVLADNPSLNVRPESWYQGEVAIPQPIRVIVDSDLKIPLDAKLFSLPGEVWVVCAGAALAKQQALAAQGVKVLMLPDQHGKVDLAALLQHLHDANIHDVIIEAGNVLAGAFVQQKLVNEIWLYMAPVIMGDEAKGLFHIPAIRHMRDKIELNVKDLRAIGNNWRWILNLK